MAIPRCRGKTSGATGWWWLLLIPLLLGPGPCGPISGGRIDGETATEPVTDWRFTNDISTIQVETNPADPYSVTTWCVTDGQMLYVPSRNAARKQWVKNVLADPNVRLRIGDKVYERRAVRVTDPAEMQKVVTLLRQKYTMARWGMSEDPAESPDTWYFRMDPR
jgi:hypothetical protein